MDLAISGEHSVLPPIRRGSDPVDIGRIEGRKRAKKEDRLQISDKGKHLSSQEGTNARHMEDTCSMETRASRVRVEIRNRIESGFYDGEEVVTRVAERLLDLFGL
jgi:hypothetical protein